MVQALVGPFHFTVCVPPPSAAGLRLCSKLFRGAEFVKMHLDAKHRDEAKRIIEDKYFDCALATFAKCREGKASGWRL